MLRPASAKSLNLPRRRFKSFPCLLFALCELRVLCVKSFLFLLRGSPMNDSISRRDILRTLAVGAAAGSVLQVIPADAAEYVHQMVHKEKAAAPAAAYTPKYFPAAQYAMLTFLCDTIIPKDEKSGGAVEAG